MDIKELAGGASIMFVLIFTIWGACAISANEAKKDITSSCKLSGHVVIHGKAYKCELID